MARNSFYQKLIPKNRKNISSEQLQKYALIKGFGVVGILAGLVELTIEIANLNLNGAILVGLFVISMLFVLFYLRNTKNVTISGFLITTISYAAALTALATDFLSDLEVILPLLFAIMVFGLNSREQAISWIILFVFTNIFMYALSFSFNTMFVFSYGELIQLVFAVLIISGYMFIYEEIIVENASVIAGKISELQKSKKKLTDIVEEKAIAEDDVNTKMKRIERQNNELEKFKVAMLNLLEDIDEEKTKAAAERNNLQTILQSIGDGVLVLDKDKKIVLMNRVAEELTKFKLKDVEGKLYTKIKFVNTNTGEESTKFINKVYETGQISKMEKDTTLLRKDGTKIEVADSVSPIKSNSGRVLGCVVVFRDATQEREVDRMKSEFVSVASHQLKTPLTAIKWAVEKLTQSEDITIKEKKLVQQISLSNARMIDLVNDLLSVSRIESGKKFNVIKAENDILRIIDSVVEEQKPIALIDKVKIKKEFTKRESLILNVDKQKIRQVFHNLINNGIKYSRPKDTISISYEKTRSYAKFKVKDNGIGIPKKAQKQVFEKFFRADNATEIQTEGNGLGLYIVKAIVEAHGGKISFKSSENTGTEFNIQLPLSKKE